MQRITDGALSRYFGTHQCDLVLGDVGPVDDPAGLVDADVGVEPGEASEGLVDELPRFVHDVLDAHDSRTSAVFLIVSYCWMSSKPVHSQGKSKANSPTLSCAGVWFLSPQASAPPG